MRKDNWLIIGISGATCSGKSTIAKQLQFLMPESILLHQDDYFHDEKSEKHTKIPELSHINFEILSSIDMPAYKRDIKAVLESEIFQGEDNRSKMPEKSDTIDVTFSCRRLMERLRNVRWEKKILIIEGFLIFNDNELRDLCDLRFYITLTKDICWERRKVRTYEPPDVPGYFDKYVWPHYLLHYNEVLKKCTDVVYIDGANSLGHNFERVLQILLDFSQ